MLASIYLAGAFYMFVLRKPAGKPPAAKTPVAPPPSEPTPDAPSLDPEPAQRH